MITGNVFDIKRFAVHDGPGIRTTLFLKGCPLNCLWCHNPEGIGFAPQLAYYKNKCIGCRACEAVCPEAAHTFRDGAHSFDRKLCAACGKCSEKCLSGALKLYGTKMTADELMPLLLEDREFYENSGGGVTLSGGECLLQADFCAELLRRLKYERINTAVDTCGFAERTAFDKVMDYTDMFLYDIKAIDEAVHISCTGSSNKIILENLKYLDDCGKAIEIRIPFVPDYNESQIEKIAVFLRQLKNISGVRVLPYHNYAGSKYAALDMENRFPHRLPQKEDILRAEQIFTKEVSPRV